MTVIALPWQDVPEELPVVIIVGNEGRDLRKKLLRVGTDETLDLASRHFRVGSAHPAQLHASVVDSPNGEFVVFDAGTFWSAEMRPGAYARNASIMASVCRRASAIVFDHVDRLDDTRSIASMARAFGVPRAAIFVDHLPLEPPSEDRKKLAIQLAAEAFTKRDVFEGDLRDVAECGPERCDACVPYRDLLDYILQPRKISTERFRMLVQQVTGWGIKPYTRIARGPMRGEVAVGDEIEVIGDGQQFPTVVDDVARGGVVFSLDELDHDQIDGLAYPDSVDVRDIVAARAYGEPQIEDGQGFVEGVHVGRIKAKGSAKKKVLQFARRVPFRRGDVVTVVAERDQATTVIADSYVILDD